MEQWLLEKELKRIAHLYQDKPQGGANAERITYEEQKAWEGEQERPDSESAEAESEVETKNTPQRKEGREMGVNFSKLIARARSKRWRMNQKYCWLINDDKTDEALALLEQIDALDKEIDKLRVGISPYKKEE